MPAATTTVDAVASAVRARILGYELEPGAPLREVALAAEHGVARHTVRAALRALAAEGIVRVEANRGARVTRLDEPSATGLYDLRTALEAEGARRALARGGGRLPAMVHAALDVLRAACTADTVEWAAVADAHTALHAALVQAAGSPRLLAAHRALEGEQRLFAAALRPVFAPHAMLAHHEALLRDLEAEGPDAIRAHLQDGLALVRASLDHRGR